MSGTTSSCDDSFLYEIDEIALQDSLDVPHLTDVGFPGAWDWCVVSRLKVLDSKLEAIGYIADTH